jgi:murein DD-endopeptidase MepM/ murein hydrolase activator NlpD
MMTPASLVIDDLDDAVLIDRPTYDHDAGKTVSEVELAVNANRWALRAGEILNLTGRFGPIMGRWIVQTVEQNLLDANDTTVTAIKPLPPRDEPAPEIVEVQKDTKAAPARGRAAPGAGAKVASAPLARAPRLIGKPYEGTHAKAFNIAGGSDNWESENAVDLGIATGTQVLAVSSGTIGSSFGSLGQGGRFAGLRLHLATKDNEWYYAHLSRFADGIRPGTRVKAGQLLGYSGEANGVAHLHLASKHGNPIDLLGLQGGS